MLTAKARGALAYAAHGWAVFPCIGKEPAVKTGFKAASTDASVVREWWVKRPKCNVAIATGEVSGLWVLDLDRKHPTCWDELRALVEARGHDYDELRELAEIVQTASGGEHWYFAHHKGIADVSIGAAFHGIKGVDWRSTGGYVIAPPSTIRDVGSYTWVDYGDALPTLQRAPEWFERMLLDPKSGGQKPLIIDLKGADVYEGENRFRALQQMSGHYLATCVDEEAAFCALVGWSSMHCKPPYDFDKVQSIFRGVLKEDRGNHPEREIEREQLRRIREIREGKPSQEELDEAAEVNRWNDQAHGAITEHDLDEARAEDERDNAAAELRAVQARKSAQKKGLLVTDGSKSPGWALEDEKLKTEILEHLQVLLGTPIARWIRFDGEIERYVMQLENGCRVEIGPVQSVTSSAAFERKLYDGLNLQLTDAAKKQHRHILSLLGAIREDFDTDWTDVDQAIDLLRLACSRNSRVIQPSDLATLDDDGKLRAFEREPHTQRGKLRVRKRIVERAGERQGMSAATVRRLMQGLGASISRATVKIEDGQRHVRHAVFAWDQWQEDWLC